MTQRTIRRLATVLLLVCTGCHFHGYRHPHGMPPGQAKKLGAPVHAQPGHAAHPLK